jgi:2-isopropylmalate synthase
MTTPLKDRIYEGSLPVDFNWNSEPHPDTPIPDFIPSGPSRSQLIGMTLVDEGLRDGLGSIQKYPSVESMETYIQSAYDFGIRNMTVGIYSGVGNRIDTSIKKMLGILQADFPSITPIVLSLTTKESLAWLSDCKKINDALNAIVFIGTSPSRLLVEEWSREFVLERLAQATHHAVHDLHVGVIGATEHTTQTPPDFLVDIIRTVVENGATKFCIADTIGVARPIGAYRITSFVKSVLSSIGASQIEVDWHGHDDLHNAVASSLTAISAGADRVHVVARGRGERAGNTMLEGVVINAAAILEDERAVVPWELTRLTHLLETYDKVTKTHAPLHGTLGANAFKTSLGIHTAAMHKAQMLAESFGGEDQDMKRKLEKMSRQIYTAIDPYRVGREHQIVISPWSGNKTVELAYRMWGGKKTLSEEVILRVLTTAKHFGRELTHEETTDLFKELE